MNPIDMKKPLEKKTSGAVPNFDDIDPKELDFFVERLAEILLKQVEYENENNNEKANRLHTTL
jgi:hypothetical protein